MKNQLPIRKFANGFAAALFATVGSTAAMAQGLQDVKYPSGAEMVYGPVIGASDMKQSLGFILSKVHGHYGSKPQLGGFFRSRSGEAIGAFFNVSDENFTHQKQSGLVLLEKGGDGTFQAAVLTDVPAQFKTSINGLLKKLQDVWGNTGTGQEFARAPVAPLQTVEFPDGSASIQLAQGWSLPIAHMGGALAAGPNGELMGVSVYLPVLDPNMPVGRQTLMNFQRSGRGLPGKYCMAPYGADPAQTFTSLFNQFRQKYRMMPGSMHVDQVKRGQSQMGGNDFLMTGQFQDNRLGSERFVAMMNAGTPNPRLGGWPCTFSFVMAPDGVYGQERGTLLAMVNSLQQNNGRIAQMGQQESDKIREYTAGVLERARESQKNFDTYMAGIDNMHDAQAQQSKAFQNLQLGNSTIREIGTNNHGTFDNDYAYGLVKSNPDKYEYVPTNEFIKGLDY